MMKKIFLILLLPILLLTSCSVDTENAQIDTYGDDNSEYFVTLSDGSQYYSERYDWYSYPDGKKIDVWSDSDLERALDQLIRIYEIEKNEDIKKISEKQKEVLLTSGESTYSVICVVNGDTLVPDENGYFHIPVESDETKEEIKKNIQIK